VNVTSGKVAVSIAENAKSSKSNGEGKVQDLLLLPNQQAVLSRKEAELVRSLVKEPVLVRANAAQKEFVFIRTPVNEVFEKLKTAYSVPITYDAALFARCDVTADLTAESLYEKLDVICKSIEANYKSEDGQIVITGNGCN
jgi:transmembrane sensor